MYNIMGADIWTEAKMKLPVSLEIFHDYLEYNRGVLWFVGLYY
jgi:hypothetical protein